MSLPIDASLSRQLASRIAGVAASHAAPAFDAALASSSSSPKFQAQSKGGAALEAGIGAALHGGRHDAGSKDPFNANGASSTSLTAGNAELSADVMRALSSYGVSHTG